MFHVEHYKINGGLPLTPLPPLPVLQPPPLRPSVYGGMMIFKNFFQEIFNKQYLRVYMLWGKKT